MSLSQLEKENLFIEVSFRNTKKDGFGVERQ